MQFSKEEVHKFQQVFEEHFQVQLEYEQAKEGMMALVKLLMEIMMYR